MDVQTPVGPVSLRGDVSREALPTVLFITGAGARNTLDGLQGAIPDVRALVADLPGNRCPRLSSEAFETYVEAFSTVVDQLSPSVIVCGSSAGGLIALALRNPNLAGIIALDPPLRPHLATPLHPLALRAEDPSEIAFCRNVFGISPDAIEPRDYFPLLDGLRSPCLVLAGALNAPAGHMPSLLSEADRRLLHAHQKVTLRTVSGVGHDIGRGASSVIVRAIQAVADASRVAQLPTSASTTTMIPGPPAPADVSPLSAPPPPP